jgi:hypothetical protein
VLTIRTIDYIPAYQHFWAAIIPAKYPTVDYLAVFTGPAGIAGLPFIFSHGFAPF